MDKAFTSYWFAWSVLWPGSALWDREARPNASVEMPDVPPDDLLKPSCPGGRDCIPALSPTWIAAGDTSGLRYLTDEDRIVGIHGLGATRAYPLKILWRHEAINDRWGAKAVAVTYSSLTGSAMVFDAFSQPYEALTFGVTGSLFNSNTIFYDRETDSFWSQMRMQVIRGPLAQNRPAESATCPFIETTWGHWKTMFSETEVISSDTGYAIDYTQYPYITPRAGGEEDLDYRTDPNDTFRPTEPPVDHLAEPGRPGYVEAKDLVFGVIINGEAKGYLWNDLFASGSFAVVNDTVGGVPIVVFSDANSQTVVAYERSVGETMLDFAPAGATQ